MLWLYEHTQMSGLYKACVFSIKNTVEVFAAIAGVVLSQGIKQPIPHSRKIKFIVGGGGGERAFSRIEDL